MKIERDYKLNKLLSFKKRYLIISNFVLHYLLSKILFNCFVTSSLEILFFKIARITKESGDIEEHIDYIL